MTHYQALIQAQVQGAIASAEGKSLQDNPYHVGREPSYYQAWIIGYNSK